MKPILTDEIEYASKILFDDEPNMFYDDIDNKTGKRVDAIQCLESKSIVACPGSGKTTVLLAKLIILANRMPFEDGRGICVLTHTNVAIDLIKEKLGSSASKLFAYPNFFGTIQSFVNRFLTIPGFVNNMGFRPIIDTDKTNNKIAQEYDRRFHLPKGWLEPREGAKFIQNLYFNILNPEVISKKLYGDPFAPEDKNHYKQIKKFKEDICRYGYLNFSEAYTVANSYLSKHDKLIEAIQERFKFVFIDEMQDTAQHQSHILDKLFIDNKTTLQVYGDPNQAIYDYDGLKGDWKPDPQNSIFINDSKRFGLNIARIINPLRISPEDHEIKGNNNNSLTRPHLLIFDEKDQPELSNVLDQFASIILKNKLHLVDNPKFVAIGRVGKVNDKKQITIPSYWNHYKKESSKQKEDYSTLIEYIGKDLSSKMNNYSNRIINGIIQILDIHDFKNEIKTTRGILTRRFTRSTLFLFLKEEHEDIYYELRDCITSWGSEIRTGKQMYNIKVYNDLKSFASKNILALKNISLNENLDFWNIPDSISKINEKKNQDSLKETNRRSNNIYQHCYMDGSLEKVLDIKLNTIHGEKGETHTATLYLETYKNDSFDSLLIKNQLQGRTYKKSYNLNASKLAYVAMSRPRELLCFAVRKESIKSIIKDPKKYKTLSDLWEIIEI